MNAWIIVAIIAGLLMVAGVAVALTSTGSVIAEDANAKTCTSCGGSCSAGSNCGLASCQATQGGTCGCGK